MYIEIEQGEYLKEVPLLHPLESFTDIDGIMPFGYGHPAIDTVWGLFGAKYVYRCFMTKKDRRQADWDKKFYKALKSDYDKSR